MGDKKVAFCALAEHGGNYGPFNADRPLVFNKLITNISGGYSPCSGVFTAPVAGVYYFTFFFHSGSREKSELMLMKNNDIIALSSDKSAPGTTDTGGNAAVLDLQINDTVSVRLPAGSTVWGANNTTSFSGFLIN